MKLVLIIVFAFFISSCDKESEYLYYDNPPVQRYSSKTYPIKQIQNDSKVDILWVVDNSLSMEPIQQNIVANAKLFMQEFLNHKFLNWKMGVISTSDDEDPYLGFATDFDHTTHDQVSIFQQAVNSLGVNGRADEHIFYNTLRMFKQFGYFFRNSSNVAIIMVSDEKEHSEADHGINYSAMNTLDQIRGFVSANRKLRFYGALQATDLQNCPERSSWDYGPYAGSPYQEIINATGGMIASACVNDFGQKLAAIGKDIVKLIESPKVLLNERPVVESIKVYYQNVLLSGGDRQSGGLWYYDYYYNSINFYDLSFSTDFDNDDIEITFDVDDGIDRE